MIVSEGVVFDSGEHWDLGFRVPVARCNNSIFFCGECENEMDKTDEGYIVCEHCSYGFKNEERALEGICQVYRS